MDSRQGGPTREHEEAVKKLISRQKSAGKAGARWRINVLKRELMGNSKRGTSSPSSSKFSRVDTLVESRHSTIAKQQQVFKHFEPELVKLAAAISKDRRKQAEKRREEALKAGGPAVEDDGFKADKGRDLDSSELLSHQSSSPSHNSNGLATSRKRKGKRSRRKRRKNRRSKSLRKHTNDGDSASHDVSKSTPEVNFHPLLQLSGSRIHVVEGGATDFYSIN